MYWQDTVESDQLSETTDSRYSQSETGARIKLFRISAGLTQAQVADRTGLSIGFVSQVENGLTSVSLSSLYLISEALGVTAPTLLTEDAGPNISVVRGSASPWYELIAGQGPLARDLTATASQHIETRENILPGDWACDDPWSHAGLEFLYVLSGTMTVELVGLRIEELHAGDSMLFPAHIPHKWGTTGSDVRVLEVVNHIRGTSPHQDVPASETDLLPLHGPDPSSPMIQDEGKRFASSDSLFDQGGHV